VTSFIGDHGIVAVFVLMAVAAVLPAASELTMLYGGALASGALAGHVGLFGDPISTSFWAYVALVVAGTAGNTVGALVGWLHRLLLCRPRRRRLGRRRKLAYRAPRPEIPGRRGDPGNRRRRVVHRPAATPLDYHGSPCLRYPTLTSRRSTGRSSPS
jgi:hypothetical protein